MKKGRYSEEQIIGILKEADAGVAQCGPGIQGVSRLYSRIF